MDWINVNKEMPQVDKDVLVCWMSGNVIEYFVGYSDGVDWYDSSDGAMIYGVSYWCEIVPPVV